MTKTQALRRLLNEDGFIYMPVAYPGDGGLHWTVRLFCLT
jgi:hypothetical protein